VMNVVVLIGRLTRDPELRYTASGTAVANTALAVERNFRTQDGEKQVDFVNIVVWQKSAEALAQHKKKGDLIAVQGRLQIRNYEDRDGVKRQAAEVVCNDVRFLPDGRRNGEGTGGANAGGNGGEAPGGGSEFGDDDQEVPF